MPLIWDNSRKKVDGFWPGSGRHFLWVGYHERIDRLEVVFDDESLVADGGLLAAGTLFDRLGLEELWDEMLRLGGRVGGANPGRKVLSLVVVRCWWVAPISITLIGCGPEPPRGCCRIG